MPPEIESTINSSKIYADVEYRKYVMSLESEIQSMRKEIEAKHHQLRLSEGHLLARERILEKLTAKE